MENELHFRLKQMSLLTLGLLSGVAGLFNLVDLIEGILPDSKFDMWWGLETFFLFVVAAVAAVMYRSLIARVV